MRSVILSQWRERRMELILQLRLREIIVERLTVIMFGVNDGGSNGTGS